MKTYANNDDCVVIADEVLAETGKAILCRFGAEEIWIPFSIADCSGEKGDTDVGIVMPFWFAEKNELEDFIRD